MMDFALASASALAFCAASSSPGLDDPVVGGPDRVGAAVANKDSAGSEGKV